jgi:hypothetical protein
MYSNAWRAVKYSPRETVTKRADFAWEWLDSIKLWWAHVTVMPEASKIDVFNKGIWKGLKGKILRGGHKDPNSIVGERLLWKKAQKNPRKKNTSDVINKIIPHCIPIVTIYEWRPW